MTTAHNNIRVYFTSDFNDVFLATSAQLVTGAKEKLEEYRRPSHVAKYTRYRWANLEYTISEDQQRHTCSLIKNESVEEIPKVGIKITSNITNLSMHLFPKIVGENMEIAEVEETVWIFGSNTRIFHIKSSTGEDYCFINLKVNANTDTSVIENYDSLTQKIARVVHSSAPVAKERNAQMTSNYALNSLMGM